MSNEDTCVYIRKELSSFMKFRFPYKTYQYLYNTSDKPKEWSILTLEGILEKQIYFDPDKPKYQFIRVQCVDKYYNQLKCYKFGY